MPTRQFGQQPELPAIETGITLLELGEDLGLEPLHALVIDRLLFGDGDAHWVDAGGHARTTTLRDLTPHGRYLDRIHVGRGFMPFQHAALIDRLAGRLERECADPALIVAPAIDLLYREDEIPDRQAHALLLRRLATLVGLAREHDVPVLVTRTRADDPTAPLETAAHRRLSCESTRFGPRFTTPDEEVETLVYPLDDGWVQTTIAFWRDVHAHRARNDGSNTAPVSPARAVSPGSN